MGIRLDKRALKKLGARYKSDQRMSGSVSDPAALIEPEVVLNFVNDLVGTFLGDVRGRSLTEVLSVHEDLYENTYSIGIDIPDADPPTFIATPSLAMSDVRDALTGRADLAILAERLTQEIDRLVLGAFQFVREQADTRVVGGRNRVPRSGRGHFTVKVRMLTEAEGGRTAPVLTGYRPQLWFGLLLENGAKLFDDALWAFNEESLWPGDEALIKLEPLRSELTDVLGVGVHLEFYEGHRKVAEGVIDSVVTGT